MLGTNARPEGERVCVLVEYGLKCNIGRTLCAL